VLSQHKPFHILIVDDNSLTADKGSDCCKRNLKVVVFRKQKESGLGTAMFMVKWALGNKYDFIFEMDADFSQPNDPRSYTMPFWNADLAIGSRYVTG
jgi:dolichol-phosphate mannosyltransferase